jgi:spore germination protein YaaH
MRLRSVPLRVLAGLLAIGLPVVGVGLALLPSATADTAPRRIVSGWLPYWSMPASLASVTSNADLWSDASPFWYYATSATTISERPGAGDSAVVSDLRSRGILVVPTVSETLSAAQMAPLLSDPAQRALHVEALTALAATDGYDGIDLDYESMNFGGTAEEKTVVRDGFVALVQELGAALDARGKLLSVTVGARTATTNWWPVHDYARLGAVADRFRIMAYDFHYRNSTPGAIAPLDWANQVASYAVTVVPKGKIQLGVPLYGYDWPRDPAAADGWGTATSLSFNQVEALRASVGATRQWSSTAAAPYFTYTSNGIDHEVWYNDADSTRAKMTFIEKYGIKGLVFWAVGAEDTRQWPILRSYAIQRTTQLTASAPAVVTYGGKITVSGKLTTAAGAAVAGARVALHERPLGTTTWKSVATTTSSATGAVAFSYMPPANREFRLYAPASWSYLASVSPTVKTLVRWRVSAAFADSTITRGTTAKLRGSVAPVRAGTPVRLDRYVSGSWTYVASTTVSSTGTYVFSFAPRTAGTYTYRVRVPATTSYATGYSPTIRLYVS